MTLCSTHQTTSSHSRILVRLLSLLLLLMTLPGLRASSVFASSPGPVISAEAGQLPLAFIPNIGQTHPSVQYQMHTMGGTAFFTPNEVVLSLPNIEHETIARLRFEGANPLPTIQSFQRLPGVVNYVRGNQPDNWQLGVPMFAGIVYEDLYPGIDVRYDGITHKLKGTFTVAPGVDPSSIRWRHMNAQNVQVDDSGNLVITLSAKNSPVLIETAPIAWQDIDGQRVSVAVAYAVAQDGSIAFTLGAYNSAYPLVIDPTIEYSTYLGGSGMDLATDIAIDPDGNSYVVGTTTSSNLPGTPINAFTGGSDIFVAKINPTGSQLVYLTYLGGSRDGSDSEDIGDEIEEGNGIAIDSQGNAYITGTTDAIDFPTRNAFQSRKNGELYTDDAFVAKLNANGTLNYSTYLGGDSVDEGEGVAVDSAGNAYIIGSTTSTNFPTRNALYANRSGEFDAFVVKLNATGNDLVYGTYLGGSSTDFGSAIAVDNTNNVYVTGDTFSANFPIAAAAQGAKRGSASTSDSFVASLNASGSSLRYSTFLGGSQNEVVYGIAIDGSGNGYVTGNTSSSDFPTANALQATYTGGSCTTTPSGPCGDAFVTKLSNTGSQFGYSTYLGGSSDDFGYDIAVNSAGESYVTGSTSSSNFPTSNGIQAYAGNSDAFVTQLSASGTSLLYSTFLGSSQSDTGNAIAVDTAGTAYVAGDTTSNTFPVTSGALQGTYAGTSDAFVVKLRNAGAPNPNPSPSPDPNPSPSPDPDPSPSPDPDPSPSPDPDPTSEPDIPSTPMPILLGSYVTASQVTLAPDETLEYRIVLYNNGTADATIDVTNELPAELNYVAGSITGGGSYTPNTRMFAWQNVRVPAESMVILRYSVTLAVQVDIPTPLQNRVTLSVGDTQFTRFMVILLMPATIPGNTSDQAAPVVQSLTIGTQDVLTERSTQLTIDASDDTGVSTMYIREWYLDTAAMVPQWQVVQSSGWVSYKNTYDWTLGPQSGTHFVGVWVKDAHNRVSQLDRNAIDSASLIQRNADVPYNRAFVYMVSYAASESVEVSLNTQTGDADLYVWYPGNFLLPNHASVNSETRSDTARFTTPRDGMYLFMVYGFAQSTFDLTISPSGEAQRSMANADHGSASAGVDSSALADTRPAPGLLSLLTQTGMDPLGSDTSEIPGAEDISIYLPLIGR